MQASAIIYVKNRSSSIVSANSYGTSAVFLGPCLPIYELCEMFFHLYYITYIWYTVFENIFILKYFTTVKI